MNATQRLHELGQSLWLDHDTRGLLTAGVDLPVLAEQLQREGEVSLCLAARERQVAGEIEARVVSLPSWVLFKEQSRQYRVVAEHHGFTPDHVVAGA